MSEGPIVNQSAGPPVSAWTALYFYNATPSLEYICLARSKQPEKVFARSDNSLTSIAVSSNVATATKAIAHGLQIGNRIVVSGATVDVDLNGGYVIATVPSTKTYTFATAGVGDATYTEATLQIAVTAPRTTEPIWAINLYQYSGSDLTHSQWADGNTVDDNVCDDHATLAYD
jgi:hypothetical protein